MSITNCRCLLFIDLPSAGDAARFIAAANASLRCLGAPAGAMSELEDACDTGGAMSGCTWVGGSGGACSKTGSSLSAQGQPGA